MLLKPTPRYPITDYLPDTTILKINSLCPDCPGSTHIGMPWIELIVKSEIHRTKKMIEVILKKKQIGLSVNETKMPFGKKFCRHINVPTIKNGEVIKIRSYCSPITYK